MTAASFCVVQVKGLIFTNPFKGKEIPGYSITKWWWPICL